jgi:hypothetical protein
MDDDLTLFPPGYRPSCRTSSFLRPMLRFDVCRTLSTRGPTIASWYDVDSMSAHAALLFDCLVYSYVPGFAR